MRQPLSKPLHRSPLRMALGKTWFIAKRRVQWHLPGKHFAEFITENHAIMMYAPRLENLEPSP